MNTMTRLGTSLGRPKTPARPLYAARLPPIHHPLGAEGENVEAPQSEPVITTSIHTPKIRPTTARPVGTQLSAKTSMAGTSPGGLKPLPAIGEPYKKPASRSRSTKSTPIRMALKCLVICMFLSIPVLIFIVMMVLSGGFSPVIVDEELPSMPAEMGVLPTPPSVNGSLPPQNGNLPSPGMGPTPPTLPPPNTNLPSSASPQPSPTLSSSLRPGPVVNPNNASQIT